MTVALENTPEVLPRSELNLVWIDCEMTGLDPEAERLIEIAVIVTGPNLTPRIEGPVLVIHQSDEQLDRMDAWNKGTHGRSGLIDKVKASTVSEEDAQAQILEFLARYVPKGTTPMCGNTISQDRRFLVKYMPKLEAFFPLPQSRCQHPEGAGPALAAGGVQRVQEAAKAHRAG
jgi:oligoribonuclease